jgi:hypothetical protein
MFDLAPTPSMLAIFVLGASVTACSSERNGFAPLQDSGPPVVTDFVEAGASDAAVVEPLDDCADENKLVYTLSRIGNELYVFNPQSLKFTSIGKLSCPTSSGVFSMAVDRRGTAWVVYSDGRLFKVDTRDASCVETAFRPGQLGFSTFGMGFAKDDTDVGAPLSETLYIANVALGRLDLSSLKVSLVGTATHGIGEMAGTGDGKLYVFLRLGSRIVRLDKSTANILETYRPNVEIGNDAFAFAQWGGDFWLFTQPSGGHTKVTRYSPATDTSTVVIEDTGMLIVGAGSSTCAPSVAVR